MADAHAQDRHGPDNYSLPHATVMDLQGGAYDTYLEGMRQEQYPMLKDTLFLDHAGSSIPCKRLLDSVHRSMLSNLYGNPHSSSAAGQQSSQMIQQARIDLLRLVDANADVYDLVFTANATAAIKLVGDALRDGPGGFSYAYHIDSHTSLVGLRELAGEHTCFEDEGALEDWSKRQSAKVKLFAYPAQSNMNGLRLPLSWCKQYGQDNVFSIVDAAAYASTAALDVNAVGADFTVISLYKMFGYPDLGALIVRKSAGHLFDHRKYFGGGTVDMVVCGERSTHACTTTSLHDRLEDGTLPVHNVAAVSTAMSSHRELFGTLKQISAHTLGLAQQLHQRLKALRHANGGEVCQLYSSEPSPSGSTTQGPIIAFNLKDENGRYIDNAEVDKLAAVKNIQLRTGAVCNPGGTAKTLGLTPADVLANHAAGHRCGSASNSIDGQPTGVIRVSLGAFSTRSDVLRFASFVKDYFVSTDIPTAIQSTVADRQQLIVESLTIYPIKSCAGWPIARDKPWAVHAEGLAWDREWCIVELGSGRALSQKQFPRMALIRPEIDLQERLLRIAFVGQAQKLEVPLDLVVEGRYCPTQVCSDTVQLHKHGSAVIAEALSSFLGVSCTLARFPAARSGVRHSKEHLKTSDGLPSSLLLSNESPILTITRASLDAVNEALKSRGKRAVHHSCFRANIILAGPPSSRPGALQPWSEDDWQQLQIRSPAGVPRPQLQALGGCRRCQMVCVDQQSGEKRPEVFLSLARQRRRDGKVLFGIHCALDGGQQSTIQVNDIVDIS